MTIIYRIPLGESASSSGYGPADPDESSLVFWLRVRDSNSGTIMTDGGSATSFLEVDANDGRTFWLIYADNGDRSGLQVGTWHSIAIVNNGESNCWINGVIATNDAPENITGNPSFGTNVGIDIRGIALIGHDLTQAEITAHYKLGPEWDPEDASGDWLATDIDVLWTTVPASGSVPNTASGGSAHPLVLSAAASALGTDVGNDNGFGAHLRDYPRGREYAYFADVTGCPYVWCDGKTTLALSEALSSAYADASFRTVIRGGLASNDWTFSLVGDPMSPLDVGGGATILLEDDLARRTRRFFAPAYDGGATVRQTAAINPGDTTITVTDSSVFSDGDYAYIGIEALYVDGTPPSSTTVDVARAQFGSIARDYPMRGITGTRITASPLAHRGRYVSVWCVPLADDGSPEATPFKIWAGRLASVEFDGSIIRLSCDNLLAALTKDDWPPPLPTGHMGDVTATFYMAEGDWTIGLSVWSHDIESRSTLPILDMGYLDPGGTFTTIPNKEGYFTIDQIARYLSDSIIYHVVNEYDSGTEDYQDEMHENFAIVAEYVDDGKVNIRWNNDTRIGLELRQDTGIGAKLIEHTSRAVNAFVAYPNGTGTWYTYRTSGLFIDRYASVIEYYPTNPDDVLDPVAFYGHVSGVDIGFARIYNGESFELISFTGEEAGTQGRRRLTGVRRGLGGTSAQSWGYAEGQDESGDGRVEIAQVWMIDYGEPRPVADFLLPALLGAGGTNGDSDLLNSRFGLGIPEQFVNTAEITTALATMGLDAPRSFWITDTKKGKEDFASFLQANSVHLAVRRFTSPDSYPWFGVTVVKNEIPSRATYTATVADADRSSNTTVATDFNERLIVNTIRLTPFWNFNRSAAETGGYVHAYAEESIVDYGQSKVLEIRPSALYATMTAGGLVYDNNFDIYNGLATKIGLRWFGSFARGNYTLTMEAPHTGWRYQVGDKVSLSLTGVISPTAGDSLAGVIGVVTEKKDRHGARPGASLTVRLGFSDVSELCPAMRVTGHSGGTALTVETDEFTNGAQFPPFPDLDQPTVDSHWFDHTAHGGNFVIWAWEEGDYANGAEYTVSASGDTSITLTSALSSGHQSAATAGTLYVTFGGYANASAVAQKFAYVGSAAHIPLLNSTDEAARWL